MSHTDDNILEILVADGFEITITLKGLLAKRGSWVYTGYLNVIDYDEIKYELFRAYGDWIKEKQ